MFLNVYHKKKPSETEILEHMSAVIKTSFFLLREKNRVNEGKKEY